MQYCVCAVCARVCDVCVCDSERERERGVSEFVCE